MGIDSTRVLGRVFSPWRMSSLIAVVGIIITAIVCYGFYTGSRMNVRHAPLIDAAMEVKLEATNAYLKFDQVMRDGQDEHMKEVIKHMMQAEWYAEAMLNGGANLEGTFIPLDDEAMRRDITQVQEKLLQFRQIIMEQFTEGAGKADSARYNHIFTDLVFQADQVETRLQQIMKNDLHNFRDNQIMLIIVIVILFVFADVVFIQYNRSQASSYLMLFKTRKALEEEMIERKRVEAELKELTVKDDLTGLYNRRGFFMLGEHTLSMKSRERDGLFMLYTDLDDFKWINDTLGHQAGDNALKDFASVLRDTYRESDVIARLVGDEFVVLPVGADGDSATLVSERLIANLEKFNTENNRPYNIISSVGIIKYEVGSKETLDELISNADKMMYEHKRARKQARLK